MKSIQILLKLNDQGEEVANLQEALLFLLAKKIFKALVPPSHPTQDELLSLAEALKKERERSTYGPATMQLVRYLQLQSGLGDTPNGVIDGETAQLINDLLRKFGALDEPSVNEFTVKGVVSQASGKPVTGLLVRAFDRDLRKSQQVGKDAITNAEGKYEIPYSRAQFARGEKASADLFVRAYPPDKASDLNQYLMQSVTLFNAAAVAQIDLQLADAQRQPSEFEQYVSAITPLLAGQGQEGRDLGITELTDEDIDFIVAETGIDRDHMARLVLALESEPKSVVDDRRIAAEIFYGWFRQELPSDFAELFSIPTDKLITTLKEAIARNICSPGIADAFSNLENQISYFRSEAKLNTKAPGARSSLSELLNTLPTPLSADAQRALANAMDVLRPEDPELVSRIAKIPGLKNDAVNIGHVLRLGALTSGRVSMTQALLQRLKQADENQGTLRPLLSIRPDEWLDLAYTHDVPEGAALTAEEFAESVSVQLEQTYPTAALAAHCATERRLSYQPALVRFGDFISQNPNFDIVNSNLHEIAAKANFNSIENRTEFLGGLKSAQRLNALGASWDEVAVLMENDLSSPHHLLNASASQLIQTLKGQLPDERILELYEAAEQLHNVTFAVMAAALSPLSRPRILPGTALSDGQNALAVRSLRGSGVGPVGGTGFLPGLDGPLNLNSVDDHFERPGQIDAGVRVPEPIDPRDEPKKPEFDETLTYQPTLQALFGSQDSCACGHCKSVLSPAAYFVDLLQFVSSAKLLPALLQRRPDLEDIELSCNNSNTEVPAIDLALEILENAIVFPLEIALPAGTDVLAQLSGSVVGPAIRAALLRTVSEIPADVKATFGNGVWTVVDGHRRWILRAEKEDGIKATLPNKLTVSLNLAGHSVVEIVATLDRGELPHALEDEFAKLFAGNRKSTLGIGSYKTTVTAKTPGNAWRVRYQTVSHVQIDPDANRVTIQSPKGEIIAQNTYNPKTITASLAEADNDRVPALVVRMLSPKVAKANGFSVMKSGDHQWNAQSIIAHELELRLVPARLSIESLTYQSGEDPTKNPKANSLAWPENHNPEAYEKIKTRSFPWSLPIDLPLEQVRSFLFRAQSSRQKLIELMLPVNEILLNNPAYVIEALGLSDSEARLISPAQVPTSADTFTHWGISENTTSILDKSIGKNVQGSPLDLLRKVSILLQQSGMEFSGLQDVINTRFVSPGGKPSIVPPNTCTPSEMTIPTLVSEQLERMHQFVRLLRGLRWPIEDLDAAILALSRGKIDFSTLQGIVAIQKLTEVLHLPVTQFLAWWNGRRTKDQSLRWLAAALSLTREELTNALALIEVADPFNSITGLLEVCERIVNLTRIGLSFEDLTYLLRHSVSEASNVVLDDQQLLDRSNRAHDAAVSIQPLPDKIRALDVNDPFYIKVTTEFQQTQVKAVASALAVIYGTTSEVAEFLLRTNLRSPSNRTMPAYWGFLDVQFLEQHSRTRIYNKNVLLLLHKSLVLCSALKLGVQDLGTFQTPAAPNHGFNICDLNSLPITELWPPVKVKDLENLLAFTDLATLAPGVKELLTRYALLDFNNATLVKNVQQLLALGLGVTALEVEGAVKQLKIQIPDQYRDPTILLKLLKLLMEIKKLGTTIDQVRAQGASPGKASGFTSATPNAIDAKAARELLRVKYGDAQWHDLIKPIADKLRERQRSALVDYLVARDGLRDVNELYERYLIDVQTSSCMKTTRLLQATAAVQLFIQRVLLHLEEGLTLDDKSGRWEWMGNYRVWEANRKVFLFPENWLLPELRDDKTPIFKQLESALTEGEPSMEQTRTSLLGYLDDFGEIAKVTVVAMYYHRKTSTLYIVGRTPNQPSRYFLRMCSHFGNPTMVWGAWEALELENANDFIMPFLFQGDLHIAWPSIRKNQEKNDLLWEVQIAWVRKTTQGWTKRKLSHDVLSAPRLVSVSELRSFVFQLRQTTSFIPLASNLVQEKIYIDCYVAKNFMKPPEYTAPTKDDGTLLHNNHSAGGWYDVFVRVTGKIFEHYNLDGKDYWRPAHGYATLEYRSGGDRNAVAYANGKGEIDFSPYYITEGTYYGVNESGVKIQNSSSFTLSLYHIPEGKSPIRVRHWQGLRLQENNSEYTVWTLTFAHIVDLAEAPTEVFNDPNRQVVFDNASQSFALETGRDMELLPSAGAMVIHDDPNAWPQLSRIGNHFLYDNKSNSREVALIGDGKFMVDHNVDTLTTLTPAIDSGDVASKDSKPWYVHDGYSSYYVIRKSDKWIAYPDGQEFVELYRSAGAVSYLTVFKRELQETLRNKGVTAVRTDKASTSSPTISFDRESPYAIYNWELFLHVPLQFADHLVSHQRFLDARKWLHAVFDPTTIYDSIVNGRRVREYWRFVPFSNGNQPEAIASLLTWLADPKQGDPKVEEKLEGQITEWLDNPFMPHVIARMRPSAYQWYTFFAYVQLLISWGDQLYRRFTRESVNQATLLYVMAAKLLGPRPRKLPAPTPPYELTYRLLEGNPNGIDNLSNSWVDYASLPGVKQIASNHQNKSGSSLFAENKGAKLSSEISRPERKRLFSQIQNLTSLSSLAFCIPQNDKLTELFDLVEKRLFDIRHCRNIDGEYRELALYDPPIDPLLLIRARAAGLSIDAALGDLYAPLPNYRFVFTLQKALELCAEVKALGNALLAALEKQDAEELARLRSHQELEMLDRVRDVRQKQLAEAEANIVALQQSQATVMERLTQYQKLLGKRAPTLGQDGVPVVEQSSTLAVAGDSSGEGSDLGLTRKEVEQLNWSAVANTYTQVANTMHVVASIVSLIPNAWTGNANFAGITFGGANFGTAASAVAKAIEMGATNANFFANRMGMFASYERRQDEWVHQSKLAAAEFRQLQKQVLAAEIRKEIAQKELENHDKQRENAKQVDDFMRDKFTNKQLHRWMVSQISDVYFRTYQMVLDQARRAERAYQYELGLEQKGYAFIQSGDWDGLKRGLLAGEHLHYALKRLENAYLDRNLREFELTKHISLVQLSPFSLIELKETGKCTFDLPEVLFDLDCPGHFMRRIKAVSLTIPCVTGPYASVNATLKLTKNEIRIKNTDGDYKRRPATEDDPRFMQNSAVINAIVTSSGQQDSGMFETNLRDERYLPFEGAGVTSSWSLSLPEKFRPFDYDTISDVVVHLRYTARDGGESLKTACLAKLKEALSEVKLESNKTGLARLFSLKHEFPTEWHRFLSPDARTTGDQTLTLQLPKERFSYLFRDTTLKVSAFDIFVNINERFASGYTTDKFKIAFDHGASVPANGIVFTLWKGLLRGELKFQNLVDIGETSASVSWTLAAWLTDAQNKHVRIDPNAVEDVFLVCRYACA